MSNSPSDDSVQPTEFKPFTLGRYQVLAPLGSGGMAQVFLAEQRGVGGFAKRVVIKQIHEQLATNERFVKMFVDEANISVNVKHSNVVQVLELQKEGNNLFMVLEFVDGMDMNTLFNALVDADTSMPTDLGIFVINSVLAGLTHAHAAKGPDGQPLNLIHRDVTPGNVLLSRSGEVKLSDFGVARAQGRMTQTVVGEVKGKYSYMAPEVMQGDAYDQRSDVFGAGVVLWEALTTRPLFRGKSDFHVMEAVLRGPIQPPSAYNPNVPAGLDAVVMQALERDVQKRFQSTRTLKRALSKFLPDEDPDVLTERLAALVTAHGGPPITIPPHPQQSAQELARSMTPHPGPAPQAPQPAAAPAPAPVPVPVAAAPAPVVAAPPPPPPRPATPAPAPAPADDDFFSQLDVAPAPAAPPAPQAASNGQRNPLADFELETFEAAFQPPTDLPMLEPEGPASAPPAPAAVGGAPSWIQAPAPGEPAFHCVLGNDKNPIGPISTASALAVLQRPEMQLTDKLGVFRGALVPLGEVGRLLMLDHLVRPSASAQPPVQQGSLRDQGVVKLLLRLVSKKSTGLLVLKAGAERAGVYLHEGNLQYTFYPDPNEHLLSLFVRHQAQGMAMLPQILTLVLRDRLQLPRVMAKVTQLPGSRITGAVASLSRDRLAMALCWDQVQFAFFPGLKDPYDLAPSHEALVSVLPTVYPRVHTMQEIAAAASKLMDKPLALVVQDPKMLQDMGAQDEANMLHKAFTGTPRLREVWGRLVTPGSRDEHRLMLALVLLDQCGMLQERASTRP